MGHKSATTRKSERGLDFYPTPRAATRCLLDKVAIDGIVMEPCAGKGDIADIVREYLAQKQSDVNGIVMNSGYIVKNRGIITNDLNPKHGCDFQRDMTDPLSWELWKPIDWVVTNFPFNATAQTLPMAWESARIGVAVLQRLTYMEPCDDRGPWLEVHAPNGMIFLPRLSFRVSIREVAGKERKSHTDNVSCSWNVWFKAPAIRQWHEIVSKEQFARYDVDQLAIQSPSGGPKNALQAR